MQSSAKTVPAYLKDTSAERQAVLNQLRNLCCSVLVGFEESMSHGMPGYSRNGILEVGFASQRRFIALYILRTDVMNAHRYLLNLPTVTLGKGCIRYSKPEKIDFKVVERMLQATVESMGEVC